MKVQDMMVPEQLHGGTAGRAVPIVHQHVNLREVETGSPMVVTRAKGNRLWDDAGREFYDSRSGMMNVNVGYGRPELVAAATEAMSRLSFGHNFFGRTTAEAADLADNLVEITPEGITRIQFGVAGSDAVDTAVKFVRHANALAGRPRKMRLIARHGGFHGSTMLGAALTGQAVMRQDIGPLDPVTFVDQPDPDADAATVRGYADQLDRTIVELGPETVAAFVAEPLALPAGLAIPPAGYWAAVQEVLRRHDVALIVDEVVTGFGRTGRMFGCDTFDIRPDVLVMSKGITSGYVPLSAVGITQELFDRMLANPSLMPNGYTTGGHPVACAVALANLELMEREGMVENAAAMGTYLGGELAELAGRHPSVSITRAIGMMGTVHWDPVALGEPADCRAIGSRAVAHLMEDGVISRPYVNSISFGPHLGTPAAELDELVAAIERVTTRMERDAV
ncbi:aminotransferase family protein [Pseudonocardia pini]|uniref:aminotransferase family protein n=1 Tax=Pseudonocardia pini TaxID=2758030 RepID=UPI0015F0DFAF|nr:aminotransferase class III-fold pyridoxal phosphate-dependent enzyme [Pseudonocardia pini]